MQKQKRIGSRNIAPCNIDMHAMQLAELKAGMEMPDASYNATSSDLVDNTSATTTHTTKASGTPTVAFFDDEFYCDSHNKLNTSDYGDGTINFDITTINDNKASNNIVKIEVGDLYFPQINAHLTDRPSFFYYNRVFLTFNNLPFNQRVHADSNRKFHFEFEVSNQNGSAVLLTPIFRAIYFRPPITEIRELSCTFTRLTKPSSFRKISLPADDMRGTISSGTGTAMRITVTFVSGKADIDMNEVFGQATGALTAPGVPIYIYSYNSDVNDSNIKADKGWFVTTIVDDKNIEIAALTAGDYAVDAKVSFVVPKNRIALHLRFTTAAAGGKPLVNLVHT